ncbi:MAG: flagellar filament capping protein FliD, partial [Clostridiaceae bacterium]|nr:flagellar filament capping protein FliD [Clostridiaceae bacterium]
GLSSGLDVDSIVQQLMKIEQAKVDKAKQSKTLLEWKRDDYRSIINSIRAFKDEYFDVLKPATNMRSISALSAYKTTYNGADTSSYFTATAGSGAIPGTFNISSIQLAQAAKAVSGSSVTGNMVGAVITIDGTSISAAKDNNKISVTFNGTTKEITLDDGLANIDSVVSNLNTKLEAAFGAGKITVSANGGSIAFSTSSTNAMSINNVYNTGYNKILGTTISSPITFDSQSNKFTIALNGQTAHTIEVDPGTYADADALMAELQEKIDAVGELNGKVRVLNQNNRIVLKAIGSTGTASGTLAGAVISDGELVDSGNSTFDVTIDGVTKSITLEEKDYTKNELLTAIQSKLNSAFGSNKAMVSMDESTGKLRFEGISATDTITADKKENGGIGVLGYSNAGKSNKLDLNAKLSDIAGFFNISDLASADGDGDGYDIEFVINGKEFQFKSSQKLSDIISAVNGDSEAGVKMSYDQLNDKIVVQSKDSGAVSKVRIEDVSGNGNLMAVLGLAGADAAGTDASITYDDGSGVQTITRASNDFVINGVAFSLKKEYSGAVGDPIEVKLEGDPTKTLELIKGFVAKYNELLDKINGELSEKKYSDFAPLTDEERAEMSDKDIE